MSVSFEQFSRKYLVSKTPITHPILSSWKSESVAGSHIYYHPKLEYTKSRNGNIDIVLFGYMYDPKNTSFNNQQILDEIASQSKNLNDVTVITNRMCGRWALLFNDGKQNFMFNDAAGQRQVMYHFTKEKEIFCGSEHLIALVLGIPRSKTVAKEYFEPYQDISSHWFVGKSTTYDDIFSLIPNHYIDTVNRKQVRFWPTEKRKVYRDDREENFDAIHQLVNLHYEAFFKRNAHAAMALTGGLDSRSQLAHCKQYLNRLELYTVNTQQDDRPELQLDRAIASEIAQKIGVKYTFYEELGGVPADFEKEYSKNASTSRPVFTRMAYQMLKGGFDPDTISIQAVVNETGRSQYMYRPYKMRLRDVASLTGMGPNPFVVKELKEWHLGATKVYETLGVRIEDLMYVEQLLGRWSAMNRSEWDIVQEVFESFNSRDIIFRIFCIDQQDKLRWPNKFYQYLYKRTWPELLDIRTSPQPKPGKPTSTKIKEVLRAAYYAISK